MRQLLKFFIMGAILFAFCAHPVAAGDYTGRVLVGSAIVAPGEQAVLPVYLEDNNIDIMALTVPLKYTGTALTVDSVSFVGSLLQPNMSPAVRIINDSQIVRFTYAPVTGTPLISAAQGLLANIYLSADASALDQAIVFDSINNRVFAGPPELWTRLEVADSSGSGSGLYLPEFEAGSVTIQTPLDADYDGPGLPAVLALNQNFPNPFNPATTISFSLPEYSRVTLKIYNIIGQEVETLVDDILSPGEHQVRWDAANVASGLYFYRLSYKGKTLTKKMALLK